MVENIDYHIDKNLKLVSDAEKRCLFVDNLFVEEDKYDQPYLYKNDRDHLANEMIDLGVVKSFKEMVVITAKGSRIIENGGWIKHLKKIKKNRTRDQYLQRMFWICAGLSLLLSIYTLIKD